MNFSDIGRTTTASQSQLLPPWTDGPLIRICSRKFAKTKHPNRLALCLASKSCGLEPGIRTLPVKTLVWSAKCQCSRVNFWAWRFPQLGLGPYLAHLGPAGGISCGSVADSDPEHAKRDAATAAAGKQGVSTVARIRGCRRSTSAAAVVSDK